MTNMRKRLLSGILALVMALSVLPGQTFAWGWDMGDTVILPIGDEEPALELGASTFGLFSAGSKEPIYASSSALSIQLPQLDVSEMIGTYPNVRIQALNAEKKVVARTPATSVFQRSQGIYYISSTTLFFLDALSAGSYVLQLVYGTADNVQTADLNYTLNVVDGPVITRGYIQNLKAFEGHPGQAAELTLDISGYQGDPGYTFSLYVLGEESEQDISCTATIAGTQPYSSQGMTRVKYLLTPDVALDSTDTGDSTLWYGLKISKSNGELYNNSTTITTTAKKFVPTIAVLELAPDTTKVNGLNVKVGGVSAGTQYTFTARDSNGFTLYSDSKTATKNGNEVFSLALSKNGMELPLSAYGDSITVTVASKSENDYMTYVLSENSGTPYARLALKKGAGDSYTFVLTGQNMLLDLYEAGTLPAFTLCRYDQSSRQYVQVGTATATEKRTYSQYSAVCYEFSGMVAAAALTANEWYYLFRSGSTTGMIASGQLDTGETGGALRIVTSRSYYLRSTFYFSFGELPLDVTLANCGAKATAQLVDLTNGSNVVTSQEADGVDDAELGGKRFQFQIPQPSNPLDTTHKYSIRITSNGSTVDLSSYYNSGNEGMIYDSSEGTFSAYVIQPVYAGDTELTFRVGIESCKNLPADYLTKNPITLVQSGAEIGVANQKVETDYNEQQYEIRLTLKEALVAGTYSYPCNGYNQTFTVLPKDSAYIGTNATDEAGILTISNCRNLKTGTYTGVLYSQDTWRNGGKPVADNVPLELVGTDTLRATAPLSGVPSGSYYLEIRKDGQYLSTVYVSMRQSGLSIMGYETGSNGGEEIYYVTKSSTIGLQTALPGYAYVRYALNANPTGTYQPIQSYYNQQLNLGADGEKTVYVQFKKTSGQESQVYTWKCRKDSTLPDPKLNSVTVLVNGQEVHQVPKNTDFTLRAVTNTQFADVYVTFQQENSASYDNDYPLEYKGPASGGGYLFETILNSGEYPFNSTSYQFTKAVFELTRFSVNPNRYNSVLDTKEYALTFVQDAAGISLDDWRYSGNTVYTNQTSYTVTGTATPNSTVTLTWGDYTSNNPSETSQKVTVTANADKTGRFSAELTGLEVRTQNQSPLSASDSAGQTTTGRSYYLVVDQAPPEITTLKASVAPDSDDNAAITWTCSDTSPVHYRIWRDGLLIDGNYHSTNYIALRADGKVYEIQAVDEAGNESEKKSITVSKDAVKPTIQVTKVEPATGGTIGGTTFLKVTGTASDNLALAKVELQYALGDSATYTPADSTSVAEKNQTTWNWSVSFASAKALKSGQVKVKAVVYDASGNTAEAEVGTFTLDNTPPAVPENFFAGGTGQGVELEWSHNKEADFQTFKVYRSSTENGEFALVQSVTELKYTDTNAPTGELSYYRVTAVDTLGNESEPTPVQSAVNETDNANPVISSVTPTNGKALKEEDFTLTVYASDNYKLGKCTVTYGETSVEKTPEHSIKSYSYTFTMPAEAIGKEITITVSDASGRTATEKVTYKKYVAPAAPTDLTATAGGDKQVNLAWKYDGDTSALSIFAVYRASGDSTEFTFAGYVPVNSTGAYTYTDTVDALGTYTYRVTAVDQVDEDGSKNSNQAPVTVTSDDQTPPVAVINGPAFALAGEPVAFSGAASTDNYGIISYSWDFGDNTEAVTGMDVTHTYAVAGEYTATLTVTDAAGNTHSAAHAVEALAADALKTGHTQAAFTVCDAQTPTTKLNGAELVLIPESGDGNSVILKTGTDGTATAILPDGRYRVSVSHPSYDTRSVWIELKGGTEQIPVIGLGGAMKGELTSKVLTLDEIKAAGINTTDPANQHVTKFQVTLGFGAEAIVYDVYKNQNGEIVKNDRVSSGGYTVYPITEKFALVIHGEAHWLKEMFQVDLVVINSSQTDTLNGVTAELTLPTGLSLAAMNTGEQSAKQLLGNIGHDGQATATWYVRGDKEGEYDLTATVDAVSMPFGEIIHKEFTTDGQNKLKVYAGSALHMTVIPDAIARKGQPYHVKFKLTNTTQDRAVNQFSFFLTDSQQYQFTDYKLDNSLTGVRVDKLTDEKYPQRKFGVYVEALKPGQSVEVDFVTTIEFNSILERLKINKPGRFVDVYYLLRDAWVSTLEGSTTSIPWSVEVNTNVDWPRPANWKTDVKYTTAYGDLFDVSTEELIKRLVEVEGVNGITLGKDSQTTLVLDKTAPAGSQMFVRTYASSARAAETSVDTDILSANVSENGQELTIQGKASGTQSIEFGVKNPAGAIVRSWIYEVEVKAVDGAETEKTLSGEDGKFAIDDTAWADAISKTQEAERKKLEEDPYLTFDSVLTWTLEEAGNAYQLGLAPAKLAELLDKTAATRMDIKGAGTTMSLDRAALTALSKKGSTVTVSAKHLSDAEAQALGSSAPTYAFETGGAAAQVTVPYTLKTGESSVNVACLDAKGDVKQTLTGVYDDAAKAVVFQTNGSAYYRIVAVSAPASGTGYTIQFAAETISADTGYELSRDASFTQVLPANAAVIPGEVLYVRQKGMTQATAFTVPSRPAAPSVTPIATTGAAAADGKILGVTTSMEYSANGGTTWTSCAGAEITGLAAGSYQVRVKAGASSFASLAVIAVVEQGSTGDPGYPILPPPYIPDVPNTPSKPGNSNSQPSTTTPGTTTVPSGQIKTPAGKDAVVSSDNTVTLPGGGDIQRRDGVVIAAPAGTVVKPDGTVIVPAQQWASVTLPSGTQLTVPGGSTIGSTQIRVGADGAEIPTTSGTYERVPGNTVLILDSSVPLGFYVQGNDQGLLFADVASGFWYYDAVEFVSKAGLMNGVAPNKFDPDANLTRAMLTQILYNKEAKPAVSAASVFTDVPAGTWYHDAVNWAAGASVVSGYGGGLFGPEDFITREQLATMLWRYAGSPVEAAQTLNFTDSGEVSGYALDAIRWAVGKRIINGMGGGLLAPQGLATRAQVAQMLKNYLEG